MDTNEEILSLLKEMKTKMDEQEGRLAALAIENETLKTAVNDNSVGGTLQNTAGRSVNMRVARSVVIPTRPVMDAPDDPRWAGKVGLALPNQPIMGGE